VKGPEYDKIKIDHYIYIVLNDRSTNTKKKAISFRNLKSKTKTTEMEHSASCT
jgi:hypothetical protein